MVKSEFLYILKNIFEEELSTSVTMDDLQKNNLLEQLKIDSLEALNLIISIEKTFSIEIEDDDLALKMINCPDVLFNFINSRQL